MNTIDLLPFQTNASDTIVDRFSRLIEDPKRPYKNGKWPVPFYQALSALTGAGKTPILADTVSEMRGLMTNQPIVLWIAKAKVVVEQTIANFETGGKYSQLIPEYVVVPLSKLREDHIRDAATPLMAVTTVGTFNDKDRATGTRKVHKKAEDSHSEPLWMILSERPGPNRERRPLIIVYDEAQNLSDQQTDLLLELEPDAILVASATLRTPGKMGKLIELLRDHGWDDESLITSVPSKKVVEAGLVKMQVIIGGYATIMESAIDDMLSMMSIIEMKAEKYRAGFSPKAIYVCRTNISQLDGSRDIPSRPFNERQAPPILIWRYLVEKKKVDPSDIALYCDLTMDRKHNPPPEEFHLFSGGEDDFAAFTAGDFHHIIFNQSLQEGWDDPSCCLAYIDKSMGSPIQVEQVIGRVLRQPGAHHYPDVDLNSAHFYIRIDDKGVFPAILKTVHEKLGGIAPQIRIEGFSDRRDRNRTRLEPKEVKTIPEIHIHSDLEPLVEEEHRIIDYREESPNIYGKGTRFRATQTIGDGKKATVSTDEAKHSNRVMARWIVRRGVQSLYPRAAASIDWTNPVFDAKVELTSLAAGNLRESADKLVNAFLQHSDLTFEEENLYTVGPVIVNPTKKRDYENALHESYSDLSNSEGDYARVIDALGIPWTRNPSSGGYAIPLLQTGGTFNFFPDFLVWKDSCIFALDPKGAHLVREAAGRKLLNIRDEKDKQRVLVRFFTEGKWETPDPKDRKSRDGITVFSLGNAGTVRTRHYPSIEKAVEGALKHK
jgi:type III restriction enzyme